ncbi:citrulline utilization hydrolase CtlX [Agromyces albus]|uniref:citrulline utilization hydrolase CtlX n=1 Tax=Agromyces albus TaxID=205332 RepID=UPI0019D6D1D1|nr:arginine deiminase-related protein [Agromyces albus]
MSVQAPSAVVLIRPHRFRPNPETAVDNAFQSLDPGRSDEEIALAAYDEVTAVAAALETAGVGVHLFEDPDGSRPDSVFPNNWFSTHPDGRVATYPMFTPNRRAERRWDVIEFLEHEYVVSEVVDYSRLERDGIFLEGTGAMVLDHVNRVAYVARSHRADPVAFERFCADFAYEPMLFDAVDEHGVPIYHTNVMMAVATDFALVGLDLITPAERREEVATRLADSGREVVVLSAGQVHEFAGNAIELRGSRGRILAMSRRAESSFTTAQREVIERSCRILAVDVETIELAGGSVRCMIAGVHLDRRPRSLRRMDEDSPRGW